MTRRTQTRRPIRRRAERQPRRGAEMQGAGVPRLWGGGVGAPLNPAIDVFLSSFAFDRRLLAADRESVV